MKKIIFSCILLMIAILALNATSFAAEQATMELKTSKTDLKQGEEFEIKLYVSNNSFEEGIFILDGEITYSSDVFQIITSDIEEEINKATENNNDILVQILTGIKDAAEQQNQNAQIAYIDDNWCISVFGENGQFVFTVTTISLKKITVSTENEEVSTIKMKVLDSANNQKSQINFNNITAHGLNEGSSTTMPSVHTDSLTIGGGIEDMEPIQPSDNKNDGQNNNNNNNNNKSQKDNDQAQGETPYTGAEDVMPFIIIAFIFGIFGYIKYRNYKEI